MVDLIILQVQNYEIRLNYKEASLPLLQNKGIPSYKIPFLVTKVQKHSSQPLRVGIYFLWIINQKSKLAKAVSADWLYFNFQKGLFK